MQQLNSWTALDIGFSMTNRWIVHWSKESDASLQSTRNGMYCDLKKESPDKFCWWASNLQTSVTPGQTSPLILQKFQLATF